MRLHPDKGGDPVIFKEIQKAYEVLSDPKKRKIYDEYGEEALSSREIEDNFDLSNIFHVYPPYPIPKKKCKKILVELNITLEDAYNGERKEVEFDKRIICPKC